MDSDEQAPRGSDGRSFGRSVARGDARLDSDEELVRRGGGAATFTVRTRVRLTPPVEDLALQRMDLRSPMRPVPRLGAVLPMSPEGVESTVVSQRRVRSPKSRIFAEPPFVAAAHAAVSHPAASRAAASRAAASRVAASHPTVGTHAPRLVAPRHDGYAVPGYATSPQGGATTDDARPSDPSHPLIITAMPAELLQRAPVELPADQVAELQAAALSHVFAGDGGGGGEEAAMSVVSASTIAPAANPLESVAAVATLWPARNSDDALRWARHIALSASVSLAAAERYVYRGLVSTPLQMK